MRTNIEIDDRLIQQAMRSSGSVTKKATVEAALLLLVKTHSQTASVKRLGLTDLSSRKVLRGCDLSFPVRACRHKFDLE